MYVFFKAEITASNSSGNLAINLCTLFFHATPFLFPYFPDFCLIFRMQWKIFHFLLTLSISPYVHRIWMLILFGAIWTLKWDFKVILSCWVCCWSGTRGYDIFEELLLFSKKSMKKFKLDWRGSTHKNLNFKKPLKILNFINCLFSFKKALNF